MGLDGEVVAATRRGRRSRGAACAGDLRAARRARFRSAPTVAELLLPLIEIGGVAILQRRNDDGRERQALEDASLMLGGSIEAERDLGGGRRIVLVRKTGPTQIRFPRRTGIPEKRPLCL